MRRVRKTQKRNKRHRKHRGGLMHLEPAALSYSLAGSDASRASLGQGADFLKYHQGQHGGYYANGAPLSAITASTLDGALRGPAHLGGLDKAFTAIAGLSDQQGGRRSKRAKKHSKRSKKGSKRSKKGGKRSKKGGKHSKKHGKHSKKHTRRHKRGGSRELEFAPFPSKGMLLSGAQYSQAGLTPEWKNAVEFDSAMQRSAM
jgi:hypothetical protein